MKYLKLILICVSAVLTGCANRLNNVEFIKLPDQKRHFVELNAFNEDEGTRIRGRMSSTHRITLTHGHIDIAAFSPEGELLAETTARLIPKKRRGGERFTAYLNIKLPANAVIKVMSHKAANHSREHEL